MHILCPHCGNPVELVTLPSSCEVLCESCGSTFRVETEATTTWIGPGAGRVLGRFELLGAVGVGAFGTVYKARDPQLDRVVALKVPRAGNLPEGPDFDRFLREARSAAQLRHPAIVPVHEVGEAAGLPYIVSEFVEGMTLADRLSAGRPTARESAAIVATVADALDEAHRQGVVHRDIKPSNIMLRTDGSPAVMDFGLAKRDAGEVTMTVDGQILGTPAYMSPEQARGESHRVDGRSDVYSLGVILYRMLTGELPFRGNSRMLLHQVLHDDPRPPRSLNDRIARDLETITVKAMAKEPGRRYASAGEMSADLRRFLDDRPILARPVGQAARLARWVRRNSVLAGLATSTVAGLLLALVATSVGYWGVSDALRRETQALGAESAARRDADIHREEARQSTRTALFSQAQALRSSTEPGRRGAALSAVRQAAAIRPGLDLRDEYLRALDMPELRLAFDLLVQTEGDPPRRWVLPDLGDTPPAGGLPWLIGPGFHVAGQRVLFSGASGADLTAIDLGLQRVLARVEIEDLIEPPIAFSTDGRFLAARRAKVGGSAVWDLVEGTLLGELKDPDGRPIHPVGLCYDPKNHRFAAVGGPTPAEIGNNLAARSSSYSITIHQLPELRLVGSWSYDAYGIDAVQFHPLGGILAASACIAPEDRPEQALQFWTVQEGKPIGRVTIEPLGTPWGSGTVLAPGAIAFNSSGNLVAAAGSRNSMVKLWEVPPVALQNAPPMLAKYTFKELMSISLYPDITRTVSLSSDGRWLATRGESGLKLWDTLDGSTQVRAEDLEPTPLPERRRLPASLGTLVGLPVVLRPEAPTRTTPVRASTHPDARTIRQALRFWELELPITRTLPFARRSTGNRAALQDVHALVFSPDERWLAIGTSQGSNGEAFLIDLVEREAPLVALDTRGEPGAIVFRANGRRIDHMSRLQTGSWDLPPPQPGEEGSAPTEVSPPQGYVATALETADGRRIAAGPVSESLTGVMDLDSGQLLWSRRERRLAIQSVVTPRFSPDDQTLAFGLRQERPGNRDYRLRIEVVEAGTGKPVYDAVDEPNQPYFFLGDELHSVSDPWTLSFKQLRSSRRLDPLRERRPGEENGKAISQSRNKYLFASDESTLCESLSDGGFLIWDLTKRALRSTIRRVSPPESSRADRGHTDVRALSSDGRRLFAIDGPSLKAWDTTSGEELGEVAAAPRLIHITATGDTALFVEASGAVKQWTPGREGTDSISSLEFEADDSTLWRDQAGQFLRVLTRDDPVRLIMVQSQNPSAAQTSRPRIEIWDPFTGRRLRRFEMPIPAEFQPTTLAVDSGGTRLAFLCRSQTSIRVEDLDTGLAFPTLSGAIRQLPEVGIISRNNLNFNQNSRLLSKTLRLSRDGSLLTAHDDLSRVVRVFDLSTQKEIWSRPIKSGLIPIGLAAISGPGRMVALADPGGDDEGTVEIVDLRSGRQIATWIAHDGPIADMDFDGSGSLLATGSRTDGTVRLWSVPTGEPLAAFETGRRNLERLALSHSGHWLAAADAEGRALIWDIAEVRRRLGEAGLDWASPRADREGRGH